MEGEWLTNGRSLDEDWSKTGRRADRLYDESASKGLVKAASFEVMNDLVGMELLTELEAIQLNQLNQSLLDRLLLEEI